MNRLRDFLSKTAMNTNVIPKIPLLVKGEKIPHDKQHLSLIEREAKIGANVFGPIPKNHRREFFMLDETTWIWYEEWMDIKGIHSVTTRYEIRANQIYKIQGDHPAVLMRGAELKNFNQAVKSYYYQVADKVYRRPIQA